MRNSTVALLFLAAALPAQAFPKITTMNQYDVIFQQQQDTVREYFTAFHQQKELPDIALYEYTNSRNTSLFAISARCMLPYATLASINRIPYAGSPLRDKTLIIPNLPGLYIPMEPRSEIEQVLYERYRADIETAQRIRISPEEEFFVLPGEDFSSSERVLFLSPPLHFPVERVIITSPFGMRAHPVYRYEHFHRGIDIDAAPGDAIYSARTGIVESIDFDDSLGNYVIVRHDASLTTYYAHFEDIFVSEGDEVTRDTILGSAGSSGMSTGTHLHLEVHIDGMPVNPFQFLPKY